MLKVVCLLIFIAPWSSYAFDFSPKSPSQTSKEAKRWSLSQWMEQKGKMQWMDVWLHSNSSSPSFYEIYAGGDHAEYKLDTALNGGAATPTEDLSSTSGHAGLFITFVGLYAKYERSTSDNREVSDALGQLRLLGTSDQSSGLTVFYGYRLLKHGGDSVLLPQTGGYLTLYLLNAWAIQGRYQHFFEKDSDYALQVDGSRIEASTWVEWGALRLYGTWYKEKISESSAILTTDYSREGFNAGIRVYLDFKK